MIKPYIVNADISIRDAIEYVGIEKEKIICIVDEKNKLLGIFTGGDLRKYLYSLSLKGFSGVSSGQRMNIKVANTKDILSNAILISYIFDSLISTMQHKIDKVDNISHLVSVLA